MSETAVLVVSHGGFADGLADAARIILGSTEGLTALSIAEGETPETFEQRLAESVTALQNGGKDVIVLADLPGATPANSTLKVLGEKAVLVTGVNLGMLLDVMQSREGHDAKELAAVAETSGRSSIIRPVLRM